MSANQRAICRMGRDLLMRFFVSGSGFSFFISPSSGAPYSREHSSRLKQQFGHQGAAPSLVLLTLHQLEVTRVLAEELVADRTRAAGLQPLFSKQLEVVKLRPSTLLRQDLKGETQRGRVGTGQHTCRTLGDVQI